MHGTFDKVICPEPLTVAAGAVKLWALLAVFVVSSACFWCE
jgi:hypothetical protein